MIRKIVRIDKEKCNGCGLCVPSCAEGAIRIVAGKAEIASDNLCDGLGGCLSECPREAITITEREADLFDEAAVEKHLHANAAPPAAPRERGCPGERIDSHAPASQQEAGSSAKRQTQLAQWPVQLHLVSTSAPYFQDADLLITADCVPFAYADYHRDFLSGKSVVVACPKLDDTSAYLDKLTEILRLSQIKSITLLRMEVPCCGGLALMARQALASSGKEIPFREVCISIRGEVPG